MRIPGIGLVGAALLVAGGLRPAPVQAESLRVMSFNLRYASAPDGDNAMACMRMPARYVAEMVCDRIAASKNYKGDKYTDAAAWEYYDRSRDHYILHPETRKELETCLLILRDEGEDACFRYIRTELLGKKA